MIQTLKKYSFWIFLMPSALIILIELLGVADLPTLIEGLGFMFFIIACTLVPDSFGKKEKQSQASIQTHSSWVHQPTGLRLTSSVNVKDTKGRLLLYSKRLCGCGFQKHWIVSGSRYFFVGAIQTHSLLITLSDRQHMLGWAEYSPREASGNTVCSCFSVNVFQCS